MRATLNTSAAKMAFSSLINFFESAETRFLQKFIILDFISAAPLSKNIAK